MFWMTTYSTSCCDLRGREQCRSFISRRCVACTHLPGVSRMDPRLFGHSRIWMAFQAFPTTTFDGYEIRSSYMKELLYWRWQCTPQAVFSLTKPHHPA